MKGTETQKLIGPDIKDLFSFLVDAKFFELKIDKSTAT